MPVGAAIAAASVVGAGATIYGANKAASTQQAAAKQASDTQMQMFNKQQQVLSPYVQGGNEANAEISRLLDPNGGVNIDELRKLPGYEFTLNQGERQLENGYAAKGLGASGVAALKQAGYATDLADTTFGNQFSRIMGRAQLGENAAAGVGSGALATGQQIGSNIIGGANAAAGATMAGANAISNTAGDLANAYAYSKLYGPGGVYAPTVNPAPSYAAAGQPLY